MTECEYDLAGLMLSFHLTIESRRDLSEQATEEIMRVVRTLPCAQDNLDDVRLALAEALANAIIHGNREDASKKVEICGGCDRQEQLLLVITDQGEGFDPSALPDPTSPENISSSHGRGVFLINRLVDQAEFNLGGRQVVLRKRLGTL